MKILIRRSKSITNLAIIVVAVLFAGFIISGCEKPGITRENFDATNLRVINCYPDKSKVKFYLDTFNLTFNTPTTSFINYGGYSIYYVVKSGARKASFVSLASSDTFATANVQLEKDKSFTLFLKGDAAGAPNIVLAEDDLTQPALDQAKIRIANMSPNSGKIDITFQLEDLLTQPQPKPEVKLLENIDPGFISDYKLLNVPTSKGNYNQNYYRIRIYEAGTQNVIAAGTRIDIRGSLIYTLVCQGKLAGSPAFGFNLRTDWAEF